MLVHCVSSACALRFIMALFDVLQQFNRPRYPLSLPPWYDVSSLLFPASGEPLAVQRSYAEEFRFRAPPTQTITWLRDEVWRVVTDRTDEPGVQEFVRFAEDRGGAFGNREGRQPLMWVVPKPLGGPLQVADFDALLPSDYVPVVTLTVDKKQREQMEDRMVLLVCFLGGDGREPKGRQWMRCFGRLRANQAVGGNCRGPVVAQLAYQTSISGRFRLFIPLDLPTVPQLREAKVYEEFMGVVRGAVRDMYKMYRL